MKFLKEGFANETLTTVEKKLIDKALTEGLQDVSSVRKSIRIENISEHNLVFRGFARIFENGTSVLKSFAVIQGRGQFIDQMYWDKATAWRMQVA